MFQLREFLRRFLIDKNTLFFCLSQGIFGADQLRV